MRISFFKSPKPRRFEFHTRYYNPDTDKAEKREKQKNIQDRHERIRFAYGTHPRKIKTVMPLFRLLAILLAIAYVGHVLFLVD